MAKDKPKLDKKPNVIVDEPFVAQNLTGKEGKVDYFVFDFKSPSSNETIIGFEPGIDKLVFINWDVNPYGYPLGDQWVDFAIVNIEYIDDNNISDTYIHWGDYSTPSSNQMYVLDARLSDGDFIYTSDPFYV